MVTWTGDEAGRAYWTWTGDAFLLPVKDGAELCRPYRTDGGCLGWAVLARAGSVEEIAFACEALGIRLRKQELGGKGSYGA